MAASPSHMDGSVVFTRCRQCAPPSNMLPWSHPSLYPKQHLDSRLFLHRSWQKVPVLSMGRRFPLKIALTHGSIWTPVEYMLAWASPSPQPNGISISSAIFTRLTIMRDHATLSVTNGCIYIRSAAMEPNNNNNPIRFLHICTSRYVCNLPLKGHSSAD